MDYSKEKAKLKETIKDLEEKVSEKNGAIDSLAGNNKSKINERSTLFSKKSKRSSVGSSCTIFGVIAGVAAALTYFVFEIMALVYPLIAIGVILLIVGIINLATKNAFNDRIAVLNNELKDYDEAVAPLLEDIESFESQISDAEAEIERLEFKEFEDKIAEGYIVICAGYDTQYSNVDTFEEPKKGKQYLMPVGGVDVYIDEMLYGNVKHCIKAFPVDPALHKVELSFDMQINNINYGRPWVTAPRPINTSRGSQFVICHAVVNAKGYSFYTTVYDDLASFLKDSGYKMEDIKF